MGNEVYKTTGGSTDEYGNGASAEDHSGTGHD